MKYFDLHCHPGVKPMLDLSQYREDTWFTINIKTDNVFHNIFDSQSNLSQLLEGKCNLVCVALHPLEKDLAGLSALQVVAGVANHINKDQLSNIADQVEGFCYQDLLWDEYRNLTLCNGPDGKKIKVIRSITEYDETDEKTIHVILSVEGGHAFYYGKNEHESFDSLIENLRYFKNPQNERLLYITLFHAAQNIFGNHAYAMKLSPSDLFYPRGVIPITEPAFTFIETCYEKSETSRRILVDIKHMGLATRKEFYKRRQENGNNDIPIIASHVACAGVSWNNIPIAKKKKFKKGGNEFYMLKVRQKKGYIDDTYFLPTTINMYDQDILEVLKSKGLFGLILDERILGYSKKLKSVKEFIVANEIEFFPSVDNTLPDDDDDDDNEDEEILKGGIINSNENKEIHTLQFINQLYHINKIAEENNMADIVWDHVVIGSDFDGLINPIDSCIKADEMQNFIAELERLIIKHNISLPLETNTLLEKLFFKNGLEFLKKHYT